MTYGVLNLRPSFLLLAVMTPGGSVLPSPKRVSSKDFWRFLGNFFFPRILSLYEFALKTRPAHLSRLLFATAKHNYKRIKCMKFPYIWSTSSCVFALIDSNGDYITYDIISQCNDASVKFPLSCSKCTTGNTNMCLLVLAK